MCMSEKLRMLRKKAGLSQEEVARELGVSKSTVVSYEKGNIKSFDLLKMFCDFYEVSISEILQESEKEKKEKHKIKEEIQIYKNGKVKIIDGEKQKITSDIFMGTNVIYFLSDTFDLSKIKDIVPDEYKICILDFESNENDIEKMKEENICCLSWNPLYYISNTERDISKFIEMAEDAFSLNSDEEKLLYSLIFYLKKYRPANDQNFISIMKILQSFNTCEFCSFDKSAIDIMFEDVIKHDSENGKYSCSIYNLYKKSAKTLYRKIVEMEIASVQKCIESDSIQLNDFIGKRIVLVKKPYRELIPLYNLFCEQSDFVLKNEEKL